jgi:outer membrane receptor for ferrienterochelin and colicins
VITKNPYKSPRIFADISSNSWLEHNIDLGLSYRPTRRSHALLGINYFTYDDPRDINKDNFTDVTLQKRISVFNKISFDRKEQRTASVAMRFIHENRWGGEMQWQPKFRGTDSVYGEQINTTRFELIGNYQLPVSAPLNFSYSLNTHRQRSAYGTTLFNADQHIAFGQLTWTRSIQEHELLVGLVGRYTFYNDNTPATLDTSGKFDLPDRIFLPGIFAQQEFKLNSRQQLLLGLRYDYDKRHKHIITPRLAYKISFQNNDVLRFNAGTGFRVVNLFTEDHAALTGARKVEIAGQLKPEKSINANLNYVKKIQFNRSWLNLDMSAWYTYFSNRILPDYTTDPNKIIYDNLDGHSVSFGSSLNAEMQFMNSLRFNAGLTVMDVRNIEKGIASRQLLSERWSGNWAISYTIPKINMVVDYTGNVYGSMLLPLVSELDPRAPESPVWSIHNIQLSRKFEKGFEVYAGIKNLLNWTPAKASSFIIARSHDPFDKNVVFDANGRPVSTPENPYALTFDPNYVYAPNQGMKIFAGIRYQLAGK